MSANDNPTADASPVKDFFISIITQDVKLINTIPEFVDNSIDGAVREADNEDYSNYFVRIDLDPNKLEIRDNCGGIPLDVAKGYAFRFGRPDETEDILPSRVGEFGIGMKRSLFKIGGEFLIESKTEENHFVIQVDVEEWRDREGEWDFPIEFIDTDDERAEIRDEEGTRIKLTSLLDRPREEFGKETFESELIEELTSRNQYYLDRGFEIIVNGTNLAYREMNIFQSDELEPAYEEFQYEDEGGKVDVKLVCGLGERSNSDAGWYVFCNGRLVLEADQSETTGWGVESDETIPSFHGQFNRFRGMVYFESDDIGMLPWNTTKTGVNDDSDVYQRARQRMISMIRPVINFLNEIAEQRRETEETPELEEKVEQATLTDISKVSSSKEQSFSGPKKKDQIDTGPTMKTIRYKVEKERLNKAKEALDASSNKEVGEKTFDYFFKLEGLE